MSRTDRDLGMPDPRIGRGCGYAEVPIRTCEVCGAVGVMWTVPLNGDDSLVLCDEDKKMVEAIRDSHVELPPLEADPIYQRLFGTGGLGSTQKGAGNGRRSG